jgi:hypothetical protein
VKDTCAKNAGECFGLMHFCLSGLNVRIAEAIALPGAKQENRCIAAMTVITVFGEEAGFRDC